MSVTDVANAAGINRAAARRFLLTLVHLGYVQTDEKRFWLTPKVLDLGYRYLSSMSWWQLAQPTVERLSTQVHETCGAAVLEGFDVVYVIRAAVARILTNNPSIGSRWPVHATSMGRVLLSDKTDEELVEFLKAAPLQKLNRHTTIDIPVLVKRIQQAKENGYAIVDQELEEGLRALAVPIRDRRGAILAAINIAVPAQRYSIAQLKSQFLEPLQEAARNVTLGLPS
jgi:IclR family pca regulon transcriptional regulator